MNRRETLKSLLLGSIGGGLILSGCAPETENSVAEVQRNSDEGYGRTEQEKKLDKKLHAQQFFSTHELETIAVLCDIILPSNNTTDSATDAEVPEFIEFIAKDIPYHKLPLRGGIMWLDHRASKSYGKEFTECSTNEQIAIIDEIAFPYEAKPGVEQGVRFFSLMRNLTLTGYYTTKTGIEDLGYKGNTPNVWDGVPEEVLTEHGLSYDREWLTKCIDQSKRADLAQWDDDGNLIT